MAPAARSSNFGPDLCCIWPLDSRKRLHQMPVAADASIIFAAASSSSAHDTNFCLQLLNLRFRNARKGLGLITASRDSAIGGWQYAESTCCNRANGRQVSKELAVARSWGLHRISRNVQLWSFIACLRKILKCPFGDVASSSCSDGIRPAPRVGQLPRVRQKSDLPADSAHVVRCSCLQALMRR